MSAVRPSHLAGIALLVVLAVLPALPGMRALLFPLTLTNIMATLAIAWNLLFGYAGLLSLGHSFFFGAAGYASAILSKSYGIPVPVAMVIGAAVSSGIAALVGLPSLKLRGHYFVLVTLVLPAVAYQLTNALDVLGGHDGIFGVPPLVRDSYAVYLGSLFLMLASLVASAFVIRSRLGVEMISVREDEEAAKALGVDTPRVKLYALMISAFLSGLAGAYWAHLNGVISPSVYELEKASMPLLMSVLGGKGTLLGPVIGAYVIQTLFESLKIEAIATARLFVFAAATFAIYRIFPQGLMGVLRRVIG
ncbi:MAG: branched-chain amino acid ABC transporter permease [Nitrososphaerota archaeon]|nr:branched-chain amino acid ABC transporter permease [Candidatus Calditenuis fumarioli]